MAFPKKDTRKLLYNNIQYLWHLKSDWDKKNRSIIIAQVGYDSGQLILVDPYHHDFIPDKKHISFAIQFALSHGWNPAEKGKNIQLAFDGKCFYQDERQ